MTCECSKTSKCPPALGGPARDEADDHGHHMFGPDLDGHLGAPRGPVSWRADQIERTIGQPARKLPVTGHLLLLLGADAEERWGASTAVETKHWAIQPISEKRGVEIQPIDAKGARRHG